ncbi:MAG: hypothetical protein OXE85_05035 [Roseovarius sp.]|nr:hypothetical protein [Roseovarius sp.]
MPILLVEISGQKPASFIGQQGIHANGEVVIPSIFPCKMLPKNIIRYFDKSLVGTFGAFDSWFFADTTDPFICACRTISGTTGFFIIPPLGKNIFTALEKLSKHVNFFLLGKLPECFSLFFPLSIFKYIQSAEQVLPLSVQ